MKKTIFVLLVFVSFVCCKGRSGSVAAVPTIEIDPSETSLCNFENYLTLSEVVPLETNDESLIGTIAKLQLINGKIYVLDGTSKQVLVFDNQGAYVGKLDKMGNSSSEYLSPGDMEADRDGAVLVYDKVTGRLLKYDRAGNFINAKQYPQGVAFKKLPDDRLAINLGNGIADLAETYNYCCYDNENKLYQAVPFNIHLAGRNYSCGEGKSSFYTFGESIYMSAPLNDTLFSVRQDGTIHPFVAFDFGKERLSIEANAQQAEKYWQDLPSGDIVSTPYAFYKSDSLLLICYNYQKESHVAIADISGKLLDNGLISADSNGLSFNPLPYFDTDGRGELISLVQPSVLPIF